MAPDPRVREVVSEILEAVAHEGDEAVVRFTEKFVGSRLDISRLSVTPAELSAARSGLPKDVRKAIVSAKANVRAFAKRSLRKSWFMKNKQGAVVGERFDPFQRVGIYVPGGTAPLVSTAIMTCTLAAAAGVRKIVAVTPSDMDGSVQPTLLGALAECGATEVYRVGGAQAIAALAFGTKTIRPVQKIFGPGNAYVVEAKRQVFGHVAIDLLPGPSEILVIADDSANSEWIAADLLAQSEHGRGSIAILLTDSPRVLEAVVASVNKQLGLSGRPKELALALKNARLVLVSDLKRQSRSRISFPRNTWQSPRSVPAGLPFNSPALAPFSWAECRRLWEATSLQARATNFLPVAQQRALQDLPPTSFSAEPASSCSTNPHCAPRSP